MTTFLRCQKLLLVFFTVLGLSVVGVVPAMAEAGINGTYIIVSLNGSSNLYYEGYDPTCVGTCPDFGGHNFGNLSSGSLILRGGEVKTWKNGTSDITGAAMFYRVYKQGETPPGYSQLNLPFAENLGGGNQKWAQTNATINLLAGLTSSGTYAIDVRFEAYETYTGGSYTHQAGPYTATFYYEVTTATNIVLFNAQEVQEGVEVTWSTLSEETLEGFNLYRSTDASVVGERLNQALIPGQNMAGANYTWLDDTIPGRGTYFYTLEVMETDGSYAQHGPVSVEVQGPTAITMAAPLAEVPARGTRALVALAALLAAGIAILRRRH